MFTYFDVAIDNTLLIRHSTTPSTRTRIHCRALIVYLMFISSTILIANNYIRRCFKQQQYSSTMMEMFTLGDRNLLHNRSPDDVNEHFLEKIKMRSMYKRGWKKNSNFVHLYTQSALGANKQDAILDKKKRGNLSTTVLYKHHLLRIYTNQSVTLYLQRIGIRLYI